MTSEIKTGNPLMDKWLVSILNELETLHNLINLIKIGFDREITEIKTEIQIIEKDIERLS